MWDFIIEFTLTDKGIKNWRHVLSIFKVYLSIAQDDIVSLPLFEEVVQMSQMSFNYYKVTEQQDNAVNIASRMSMLAKKS